MTRSITVISARANITNLAENIQTNRKKVAHTAGFQLTMKNSIKLLGDKRFKYYVVSVGKLGCNRC